MAANRADTLQCYHQLSVKFCSVSRQNCHRSVRPNRYTNGQTFSVRQYLKIMRMEWRSLAAIAILTFIKPMLRLVQRGLSECADRLNSCVGRTAECSGVPREGVWGVQTPPRNSEDIGGVLDRTSKKNRRLDFLLQFTVFSYGCNLLNIGFF